MLLLLLLLTIMFMSAISILTVPFIKNGLLFSKDFLLISMVTSIFTFILYFSFGEPKALLNWYTHGKSHYQLMTEVDRLGGFDGIIARLKTKLENNPSDAKGWMILGKLYQAKEEYALADDAFARAKTLQ